MKSPLPMSKDFPRRSSLPPSIFTPRPIEFSANPKKQPGFRHTELQRKTKKNLKNPRAIPRKIKVSQENHKKAYKSAPPLPSMPKHKEKTRKNKKNREK